MLQYSQTAQVIGRSMEPVLCEGDLIEVAPISASDAQVGAVYGFRIAGLERPAAHRLLEKGQYFRFQGDRQPFLETVKAPEILHEVRRVLERTVKPDPGILLFSLLTMRRNDLPLIFPKHCTLYWPWGELLQLAQRHRLSAMIVHTFKVTGLWDSVPLELRSSYESAWYEAISRAPLLEETMAKVKGLLPEGRFLKGAELRTLFPDPSLRTMEDIDILVEETAFEPAIELLLKAGFSMTEEARKISEFYTSATLKDPRTGIDLDLHYAPFQPERFRFGPELLRGKNDLDLTFVYIAAHAFQHWGRHGQCLLDLYLLYQIGNLDFLRAFQLAKMNGALSSFLFSCRQLRRWFNAPLPDFSDSEIPRGIRWRLALAEEFYAHSLTDNLFGRKKHILQLLLSDSLVGFWRLFRNPARRKMAKV